MSGEQHVEEYALEGALDCCLARRVLGPIDDVSELMRIAVEIEQLTVALGATGGGDVFGAAVGDGHESFTFRKYIRPPSTVDLVPKGYAVGGWRHVDKGGVQAGWSDVDERNHRVGGSPVEGAGG